MGEVHDVAGHVKVNVTVQGEGASRHYLSSDHLFSARHNAELCKERERSLGSARPVDIKHRSYAISAILASVSFLEAFVNETYEDCADWADGEISHAGLRVERLSEPTRHALASFWTAVRNGQYQLLGKYEMALLLAGKEKMDRGGQPFQDAKLLCDLRNALVHFRPQWSHKQNDLGKRLSMRMNPSPLLDANDGSPWFPIKVLGSPAAEWAAESAYNFTSVWTERLGVRPTFDFDIEHWDRTLRGDK